MMTQSNLSINSKLLAAPVPCITGEYPRDYEDLKQEFARVIDPTDCVQRIWFDDLLNLIWEVLRHRRAFAWILKAGKQVILEDWIIERMFMDRNHATKLATAYFQDPEARAYHAPFYDGITEETLTAAAYCKHIGSLEALSRLIANAENRRNDALKYIEERQWVLGHKLRAATDELINNDTPRIAVLAPENTTQA